MFPDYYETLGVTPDISAAGVKRKFRELARIFHPDANQDPKAAERFKLILEAYEVLSDPRARAGYDAARTSDDPLAAYLKRSVRQGIRAYWRAYYGLKDGS